MEDSQCYYGFIVQTLAITTLVQVVSSKYHQWRRKENLFLMEIAQPDDAVESNFKGTL